MTHESLKIGIVGAVGRGKSFKSALQAFPQAQVQAVCDVRADALAQAQADLGACEAYLDYQQMLDQAHLDAVIIGTPMQFHARQSIAALDRGLHVLCEVTAAVSIAECQELVAAANRSTASYMMAENYTYIKSNVLVRELASQGLFGEAYYAEGEYIHELKQLNETTPWRRKWQTGINGVTYGTHSLGPILQWMPGDRVVQACGVGSGHHYRDPRGDLYENEESCLMLCKTERGALIKIRVDMLSNRPHAMTNYQLQGTRGCYESARGGPGDINKIWLEGHNPDPNTWLDLNSFEANYLPEIWRNPSQAALQSGHGGGDFFEVQDFFNCILNGAPCPIDIHAAMDMTLPGLISQQSIQNGSTWLDVPDSRDWI